MYTLHQNNGSKNKGLPINGARPTPLRINKNSSNLIQKRPLKKPNEPVIIYARSPKVIHTRPQDFMALVQSLTGLHSSQSRSLDEIDHGDRNRCYEEEDLNCLPISESDHHDDHGSNSSSLSDDQKIIDDVADHIEIKEESVGSKNNMGCYLVSPTMFMPPNKASIGDMPLYTPTGLDWAF